MRFHHRLAMPCAAGTRVASLGSRRRKFMTTRREFVAGSLAGGTLAAAGCQSMSGGKRQLVDAQVHLWKAASADWPWMPGMKPQMAEPFTIEKLVPLMDEAGVERVVIVPPSWPGDRNDYAPQAASRYPKAFRVMGRIPPRGPTAVEARPP